MSQTKIIVSELEILDLFHSLRDQSTPFLIWKKSPEKSEDRLKFLTKIDQSNLVEREVRFILKNKSSDIVSYLDQDDEVFAFTAMGNTLFKGTVRSISNIDIVINFPNRINILGDEDLKVMMPKSDTLSEGGKVIQKDDVEITETTTSLSMKDDKVIEENEVVLGEEQDESPEDIGSAKLSEEEFEKMRSAPRGKSKGDQIVQIEITNGPRTGEVLYFEIYDISTGGMGLLASSVKDLSKGETLNVLNIAGKPQESGLKGTVVSLDEVEGHDFPIKFGIKFE